MNIFEQIKMFTDHKKLEEKIVFDNMKFELKSVYIFGAKLLGIQTYQACQKCRIDVKGFIDNDKNIINSKIDGVTVYSLKEVIKFYKPDDVIIISSLNYCTEIKNQLIEAGIKRYITYPILSLYNYQFPIANMCFENLTVDLLMNIDKYEWLYERLADYKSKSILIDILKFRTTFDVSNLENAYQKSIKDGSEYFDPNIVKLSSSEVFIDGGAYKGETSLEFINQVKGEYKHIYLFEPDLALMQECKNTLKGYHNITFFNSATGSKKDRKKFDLTGGTGGKVSEIGNTLVDIDCIDECISQRTSFIKLDVEGSEIETILGAKNHIKRYQPTMAISAYHHPADLWKIAETIHHIDSEYKMYLRHYSMSYFETDLYFVKE